MKREFTKREKGMMVVLIVLLIFVLYFKLILEPINSQTDVAKNNMLDEQNLIEVMAPQITTMDQMQKAIEQAKQSGTYKALPNYDNLQNVIVELNGILQSAIDYSLDFNDTAQSNAVVSRPVTMNFTTADYATARTIIHALHDSAYTNQITDLTYAYQTKTTADSASTTLKVSLVITYYELVE